MYRSNEGYAKLFLKNSRAMMAVMVSGKVCRGLRWPVWSVRQVLRLAIARSTGARSVLMALLYCFWVSVSSPPAGFRSGVIMPSPV